MRRGEAHRVGRRRDRSRHSPGSEAEASIEAERHGPHLGADYVQSVTRQWELDR